MATNPALPLPSDMEQPRERRSAPRRPASDPAWCHRRPTALSVRLKDVSEGGACFISSLDLPAETRVRLQMEHEAAWAATEAVVVRSVSRADGFFDVSIRFILDHQKDFRARFPNRGRVRMTLL